MKNNMKFKVNSKDTSLIKLNIIAAILFTAILSFLSVGFALYTRVLNVSGGFTFRPQGEFRITSVTKTASQNTDDGQPTFTDDTVDFNLVFVKGEGENPEYTATYDIVFTNDTFYERTISDLGLNFVINDNEGNSMGHISYTVTGADSGTAVDKLSEAVATVTITFQPTVDADNYTVDGGADVSSNEKPAGSIIANINNPTTGDIRNNAIATFSVDVTSTYTNQVSFTLNPTSEKVVVCDSNGNETQSFTIPAETENQTFTFYVKAKDGATFGDDTLTTSVILKSNGLPNVTCGNITLQVDKAEEYHDTTPPTISNVRATIDDEVGVVNLTWNGEDDYSGVKKYYIAVCNSNGVVQNTIDTNSDATSYRVTGLSNGTNATTYIFKVYGEDNDGNIPTSDDIAQTSTNSGIVCATTQSSYQWVFSVSNTLSSSYNYSGATTVNRNQTYTATITRRNGNNAAQLPSGLEITMGGTTLSSGSYTYTTSGNTGTITIPNVTGNLSISAESGGGVCIIEGTKILLADGTYKNVEKITFDDLLMVYDHENGGVTYEYPIWMENEHTTDHYQITYFSDGTSLKTLGEHAVFSVDANRYVDIANRDEVNIGTRIYKLEKVNNEYKLKIVKVTDFKEVRDRKHYYHVVSTRYYNIISDNVITNDGRTFLDNFYEFGENAVWSSRRQEVIDNNIQLDYKDYDFIPYYMYHGLRAQDGAVLLHYGYINDRIFRGVFTQILLNDFYYHRPPVNKNGKREWMVTTSSDKVTELNKHLFKVEEESYYKLPNKPNVKCYLNTVDNICYKGGEKVQIWTGTHFIEKYK